MATEIDAFSVETQAARASLSPPNPESKGRDDTMEMEAGLDRDRAERARTMSRLLAGRDAARVNRAIEAYRRDLPRLLSMHRERHVVAYDGDRLVAIAPTRNELMQRLRDAGHVETHALFFKIVRSLDAHDHAEHFDHSHP